MHIIYKEDISLMHALILHVCTPEEWAKKLQVSIFPKCEGC